MLEINKNEILEKAEAFFRESIVKNHIKNTEKLSNLKEFNVNPFLSIYLSKFLTGAVTSESIAKALIYPRVLGSSITTSFGTHLQSFCSQVLSGDASTTSGIDIEFFDHVDQRVKYCQIKAGPNTINKDDVDTIKNHFKGVINLARTNKKSIGITDMIVGVFYGQKSELSSHYKTLNETYPVYIGEEFWYRLTGDKNFYYDLINAVIKAVDDLDSKDILKETITKLSEEIPKDVTFDKYLSNKQ